MVFIPVMPFLVFDRPARIYIFLGFFMPVFLFIPFFRDFSFFDFFILLFCVALYGYVYKCGIYYASAAGYYSFLFQLLHKPHEYYIQNICFIKFFPEMPYRFGIGNRVA